MRYVVVFALFVLSMITYIDRACIATAKDPISLELALADRAMGMVFGAFALGYALAQIPSGWFADKAGPRIALAVVAMAWSALTALTGAAWNLTSLVAIRFLFGVAEAGAFPGSARAICNWLPAGERGRANGVLF
jgi:MFS transporter, ACS family, glucarate transporter